jgi:acetolactate decarboxylase
LQYFIKEERQMKHPVRVGFLSLWMMIVLAFAPGAAANATEPSRDLIYQVSTLNALLEGIYDGQTTFGQLRQYGDTGIGTFAGLDGEMVLVDGVFYQIKADGAAYPVADSARTPFAVVTFLEADRQLPLTAIPSYAALTGLLDQNRPTANIFYAIRIDGDFTYVKTRSVPKQTKPYPVMTEVTKSQPVFEYQNIRGSLVGFYCPPYTNGVNLPGYHLHFISADRKVGGHLLECRIAKARAALDATHDFTMVLPNSPEFYQVNLSDNKEEQQKKVER